MSIELILLRLKVKAVVQWRKRRLIDSCWLWKFQLRAEMLWLKVRVMDE